VVAEEYDGILPYCEAFYVQSIIYSADRSSEAFLRYEIALAAAADPISVTSTVHEAMQHAAALSRFFWPARETGLSGARAAKLRAAFALSDSSPLKDRRLRNALEHFDEKLDEYLLLNDTGYFFPTPLIDDSALADDATGRIFKLVDPKRSVLVILGEKYDFGLIAEEVHRIRDLARAADDRLPS
jgi:hypothetical protein